MSQKTQRQSDLILLGGKSESISVGLPLESPFFLSLEHPPCQWGDTAPGEAISELKWEVWFTEMASNQLFCSSTNSWLRHRWAQESPESVMNSSNQIAAGNGTHGDTGHQISAPISCSQSLERLLGGQKRIPCPRAHRAGSVSAALWRKRSISKGCCILGSSQETSSNCDCAWHW